MHNYISRSKQAGLSGAQKHHSDDRRLASVLLALLLASIVAGVGFIYAGVSCQVHRNASTAVYNPSAVNSIASPASTWKERSG